MMEGLRDLFQFDLTFVELEISSMKILRSDLGSLDTSESFALAFPILVNSVKTKLAISDRKINDLPGKRTWRQY